MKTTRLILIPATGNRPAPFLVIDTAGVVMDRGELTPDGVEPESMRTVAVVPGGDVLVRWLDLPAGSAAQGRAAAVWLLRDQVAAPPDRLSTVLGPPVPPGQERLVAVVNRSLIEAWTDYLAVVGVRADVFIPDVLTLSEPAADDALSAVAFGDGVALRGRRFAATVQPDVVDLVAGGRRVVAVQDPAVVESALVAAARTPAINLLDTGERERAAPGGWKRAAILAALAAASPLMLTVASAARDDMAAERMRSGTLASIAKAAPDLARDPDPVSALRRRLAAAPPPGGVSAAAAALFTAVEAVEGAELDLLIADPETGVKATISHPAYADMAAIKASMAEAGMTVTETGTLDDAGRVVSDITIGAGR
ncbi:type II secretion system protein GspL [Brevundimonas sp.]|uniref:type II secretion system protein GspL n=1 Tax=Brevundimonas sp. TaxID=1871086 RepID=UPI002737E4D6|nr:type II secretion system protein GspL [Brevundimonas sp.]MDP3801840.1 type II secretion system protein GspL [Brevundimonas sp.]